MRLVRTVFGPVAFVCLLSGSAWGDEDGSDDDDGQLVMDPPKVEPWSPHLDRGRPLSVGIDGYAGLTTLWTASPEDRARAMVGGLFRISYGYLQLGAVYETTNTGEATALLAPKQEKWTALGGFAGVMLPFEKWVDVEGTLGVVSRTYANSSSFYPPKGFSLAGPSLTWRIGISARTSRRLLGARVGAGLCGAIDLVTHDPEWERRYLISEGQYGSTRGTTPVGGWSLGLYVSLGFEISDWKRRILD